MFLAELDHEQKSSFWVVAQTMIASDGKLDEKEAIMMEQYGAEMNLSSSDIKAVDVDSAIQSLASSLPGLRKRIMFELVGLACADNDFALEEAELVDRIRNAFGLDSGFVEECKKTVNELTRLYCKIGELVNG